MSIQSKQAFMRWVKIRHPAVYSRAMGTATGQNLGALTQAQQMAAENAYVTGENVAWYEKVLNTAMDSVEKLLPVYTAAAQEKELMKINLELAKQGKPLLNKTDFATQVNVGLPKDIQYILWGALAIGGIYLFTRR